MSVVGTSEAAPTGLLRRVARSSAWYVAGFVLASVASFVISIIAGRALGPADFGRFSYQVWAMRLIASVLALGVPAALTRYVAESSGASDERGLRGFIALGGVAAAIMMPLAAGASAAVAIWIDGSAGLAVALAVGSSLSLGALLMDGILGGFRAFRSLATVAAWSGAAGVVLIAAGAIAGAGWRVFVALQVGTVAVGAVMLVVIIGRRLRWRLRVDGAPVRIERSMVGRLVRLSVTMAILALLTEFVLGRPELFFLERWWPAEDVGIYSAALRLSTLVVILPGVASRVLVSEFSWSRASGDADLDPSFADVCRFASFVGIGIGAIAISTAPEVITMLFGGGFAGAGSAAAVLLLGGTVAGITAPVGAAILSSESHRLVATLSAAAAAVNITLDSWLIGRFGVIGAATATSVALTVNSILIVAFARRRGHRFPIGPAMRLLAAAAPAMVGARGVLVVVGGALGTVLGLAVGVAIYASLAVVVRVMGPSDLASIRRPRGSDR